MFNSLQGLAAPPVIMAAPIGTVQGNKKAGQRLANDNVSRWGTSGNAFVDKQRRDQERDRKRMAGAPPVPTP